MSMTGDELDERQAIIDAGRRMNALSINQGTQIGKPPLLTSAVIERVRQRMAGSGMPER
ncbi:hypothetical protein QA641_13245 [Bradyrhizobium sp. CB1650]|uniref:hypothetical protein n=1 Tax=Bradyrhizobium sp. CB1650 TaxID=3039153 RepID=UPI0024352EE8|nr:hypothetical protein [Bradyrhizobium sp. CB1650]WGD54787.1 hypothetical protein QA641_13245 [Bradyrhizobium sp. CB1650]